MVIGKNTAETEMSTKPGVAQVGTNMAEAEVGTRAAETGGWAATWEKSSVCSLGHCYNALH